MSAVLAPPARSRRVREVTREDCQKSADKFLRRSDWLLSREGNYAQLARARGWYAQCCAGMSGNVRHTLAGCQRSALGFQTRRGWQVDPSEGKYYQAALNHGWLNRCCAHMRRDYVGRARFAVYVLVFEQGAYVGVTRDLFSRLTSHCKTFGHLAWTRALTVGADMGADEAARLEQRWIHRLRPRLRLLNTNDGGSTGRGSRFKLEAVKASALRFSSRASWKRGDLPAYNAARRNGWHQECCAHMEARASKYSLEDCLKAGARYSQRAAWFTSPDGHLYQVARNRGWLARCCAHMVLHRRKLST